MIKKVKQVHTYIYVGWLCVFVSMRQAEINQDGNRLFLYKFSIFCFS